MKTTKNKSSLPVIGFIFSAAIVLWFTFNMFLNFITEKFFSDFPAHIKGAVNDLGYSLMHLIMKFVYNLSNSDNLMALVMSLILILTAVAAGLLLMQIITILNKKEKIEINTKTFFCYSTIGIAMLFIANIYIPRFWPHFYYWGSVVTQPWHNSTYILMRMFSFLTLVFYFRIQSAYYYKSVPVKLYRIFAFLLAITNFTKPNFLLTFGIVMLAVLIYDLIKTKGKSFLNAIKFGLCVIFSLLPIFFQYPVLYDEQSDSSIAFCFSALTETIFSKQSITLFISNFLFPVVATIFILIYRRKNKDLSLRILAQGWLFLLTSFVQSRVLVETGIRATHGNFGWGAIFFALLLFVICLAYLIKIGKQKKRYLFLLLLLIPHFLSGIAYVLLINGYIGSVVTYLL